jgi:hypothetical protein
MNEKSEKSNQTLFTNAWVVGNPVVTAVTLRIDEFETKIKN